MGKRYILTFRNYDDKFWYEFQTNWFINMVRKMAIAVIKYDIVNVQYRR